MEVWGDRAEGYYLMFGSNTGYAPVHSSYYRFRTIPDAQDARLRGANCEAVRGRNW
jgi:hypothetical protein